MLDIILQICLGIVIILTVLNIIAPPDNKK